MKDIYLILLRIIEQSKGISIKDILSVIENDINLTGNFHLAPSSVYYIISYLRKKGYIETKLTHTHPPSTTLSISDKGENLIHEFSSLYNVNCRERENKQLIHQLDNSLENLREFFLETLSNELDRDLENIRKLVEVLLSDVKMCFM
ncbi:MAG: hypothetical protein GF364_14395 [Candidatus Lokiarchaeota archaeon]|nr:hypothetical protein [Candidatus Lokiarchaeota archaeon]